MKMKNILKRALATFLVVAIVLTSAPLSGLVGLELPDWLDFTIKSSAATSGTCGDNLTWVFDISSGVLTISGTGSMKDYELQQDSEYYYFYSTAPWSHHRDNIISISIGSGVTHIGCSAFSGCYRLTNITIPESILSIGGNAFYRCVSLTSIIIPDSVIIIGEDAFNWCKSLTNLKIGEGVTSINDGAFSGCSSLTNLKIGESVTNIGISAFSGCSSLTSLTIPKSVTSISNGAFSGLTGLTEIIYNAAFCDDLSGGYKLDNLVFCDAGKNSSGITVNIGAEVEKLPTYLFCPGSSHPKITKIVFEENSKCTDIGEYAFFYCTSLASVTIPESVTNIGYRAFDNCTGLTEINYNAVLCSIDEQAFDHIGQNSEGITVNIGSKVEKIPTSLFYAYSSSDSPKITKVIFEENSKCTDIGSYAFFNCSSLTNVVIPNSVTNIGAETFSGCSHLTGIIIPNGIVNIYRCTFHACKSLTSVIIPDSVTNIGQNAFSYCTNLKSISIPKNVENIGSSAFNNCTSLTDVYYTGTKEQWNKISIDSTNNSPLTNATIHYNYTPENDNTQENESAFGPTYTTLSGVLDSYYTKIELNGDNEYSVIEVNGTEYRLSYGIRDLSSLIGKEVLFSLNINYVVIWIDSIENIKNENRVSLDIPFVSELQYENNICNRDYIDVSVTVHNSCNDFFGDYEVIENVPDLDVQISSITFSLPDTSILTFEGGKSEITYQINDSINICGLKEFEYQLKVVAPEGYYWDEDVWGVWLDCEINAIQNGKEVVVEECVAIKLRDKDRQQPIVKPSQQVNSSNEVQAAALQLEYVDGAIVIANEVLSEILLPAQIDAIEQGLLCMVAMSVAPKDTFEEYLSGEIIEELFNIDTNILGVREGWLYVSVLVDSRKYGQIEIIFTCDFYKYAYGGSEFAYMGDVKYEIVGGSGIDELPTSMAKEGTCGMFTGYDIEAFCNSAYNVAMSELKSAYDMAYGDDLNTAADIIFGTSVNKILKATKYKSVAGLTWEILTTPSTSISIYCPVDVYVYDSSNNLVAAVEANKVVKTNVNVEISVDGDSKFIRIFDSSYRIAYRSAAEGSMKVVVEEYANSEEVLRTVTYDDIPLKPGINYLQGIGSNHCENDDYDLTSNNGNTITAESDVSTLHWHESDGIWYVDKEATCTEKGVEYSLCTECNKTFERNIDCVEHKYETFSHYETTHPHYAVYECSCGATTVTSETDKLDSCEICNPSRPEVNCSISIQTPSRTEIRCKDGIVLHANVEGTLPEGAKIVWSTSNNKFKTKQIDADSFQIISNNDGYTTVTVSIVDADGNVLASDGIEMRSKAGFGDKIGGFFRSLFGATKIYDK